MKKLLLLSILSLLLPAFAESLLLGTTAFIDSEDTKIKNAYVFVEEDESEFSLAFNGCTKLLSIKTQDMEAFHNMLNEAKSLFAVAQEDDEEVTRILTGSPLLCEIIENIDGESHVGRDPMPLNFVFVSVHGEKGIESYLYISGEDVQSEFDNQVKLSFDGGLFTERMIDNMLSITSPRSVAQAKMANGKSIAKAN